MAWKTAARSLLPPFIAELYKKARSARYFRGRYSDWRAALQNSTGYNKNTILKSTLQSTQKLKVGSEKYFAKSEQFLDSRTSPYFLLMAIFRQAALDGGQLRVLDFGGGLGANYFRCAPHLSGLADIRWDIVEQPEPAQMGKAEFENDQLHFFPSITAYRDSCSNGPNVILLSSVVQYLEQPFMVLRELKSLGAGTIFLDRTPFSKSETEFLTVQEVPPEIYSASYPSWVFDRDSFVGSFDDLYLLATEFRSADQLDPAAEYLGFYFTRK